LLIFVSNYGQLKDKMLEFVLYDSQHLFDRITVTNNKDLMQYNELYNNTGIPNHDLPQIILKTPNKKLISFNYFSFPDEFNSYLTKGKESFKYEEPYDNLTHAESLSGKSFNDKIFNPKFREFILEIKHEGCPTCFMLGKMTDHLTQKMHKHKVLSKLPVFRIDTENDIGFGTFLATPTYLFVRKSKDNKKIELIAPIEKNEFLLAIKRYSNYNLHKIQYHPNLMFGFITYQRKEFAKGNYDPDYDMQAFKI
jgi:hypothetical protein